MAIVWTLLVGLVVGLIARLLMPARDPDGAVVTIAVGVAGAMLAGFAGEAIGWTSIGDPSGLVASVAGAVLLLGGYRLLR
jgi:uncharacterized membrane protein YeaQ/YmgE (transglycosylase-associated protein family)